VQAKSPPGVLASLSPAYPDENLSIYQHSGVILDDPSPTWKIFAQNKSDKEMEILEGVPLVQFDYKSVAGKEVKPSLEIVEQEFSVVHEITGNKTIEKLCPIGFYTEIEIPQERESKTVILNSIQELDQEQRINIAFDKVVPLLNSEEIKEKVAQDLTEDLVAARQELGKSSKFEASKETKKQILEDMCSKLAVIGVDLLKNKTMTRSILAKAQQSDDLLSTIHQALQKDPKEFPRFEIKNQVLYRRAYDKHFKIEKMVICIPDELMPSVIHTLHTTLGHPSLTATVKNFQAYYYHRQASRLIRTYVRSCLTCAYAGKYDLKKATASTERSLQPERPRQHLYCDLLPMPKGQFSYILFCLDAYSQYIYSIPLKDKTSASVLQGFLSLFSTVGWYDAIYMDNETSFHKTIKDLKKFYPIEALFNMPYCHFQNNAENYVKTMKRTFLKLLNDAENPQDRQDWSMLLPTVTQAVNRQVIQSLGISREALHFNSPSDFYPMAEIRNEDDEELNKAFDNLEPNVYESMKKSRDKYVQQKKNRIPSFKVNQIVFMIDQAPSTQGVSSILKQPTRGPYRIQKLKQRNVQLVDLETGNLINTHIELLRPLELDEFKLLLTKEWDLNSTAEKVQAPRETRSAFKKSENQATEEEAKAETAEEIEQQEDSEDSQPQIEIENEPLQEVRTPAEDTLQDEFYSIEMLFNSYQVEEDISKSYREKMRKLGKSCKNKMLKLAKRKVFFSTPQEFQEAE